jgi:DNA-binding NarL/FixJ family response regulator
LVCPGCRKPSSPRSLSFRERQIVTLLHNEALPNKEIAFRLHLAEGTVKEYLNRIYRKVEVVSRVDLMRWLRKHSEQLLEQ